MGVSLVFSDTSSGLEVFKSWEFTGSLIVSFITSSDSDFWYTSFGTSGDFFKIVPEMSFVSPGVSFESFTFSGMSSCFLISLTVSALSSNIELLKSF